jgi:DNA-binding LacI/PurR family transcriptional regulator
MIGLQELGLKVPEDISVIGLDNSEKVPEGFPELTTVGFPHFDVGYLAAELLCKQMSNTISSSWPSLKKAGHNIMCDPASELS